MAFSRQSLLSVVRLLSHRQNLSRFLPKANPAFTHIHRSCSSADPPSTCLPPYVDPVYSYSFGRSTSYVSHTTIGASFQQIAEQNPDREFVIARHQGVRLTYSQTLDQVDRLAKGLIERIGVRRGDVIGMWSANVHEFLLVQLALARIGAVYCAISPLVKSAELQHVLNKANIKALIYPGPESIQNFAIDYNGVLEGAEKPLLKDLIHLESDHEPGTGVSGIRCHSLRDIMNKSDGQLDREIIDAVQPDDIANIYFTSGTTGKPKGAATSHTTVINCQRFMLQSKRNVQQVNDIKSCVPLPYFHGFAGHSVYCGCVVPFTQVIPHFRFTVEETVSAIRDEGCTDLSAVPTMAIDLLTYCKEKGIVMPTIRHIVLAAAHTPPAVIEELRTIFPGLEKVVVGYGATETSPVATFPDHYSDQEIMNTTVGTALDFDSIKIVDKDTGRLVRHKETGEILVKGLLMTRYWDEDEKTAEVMDNGWYRTGDLGQMDENGRLQITGRTKEMIIRGGANIYPRELEDLLHQHPDIERAGVCGVPHQRLGEEVCAWIRLKDLNSKITAQDVRQFCKDRISNYKVPAHVFFVTDFPMTASMKMQKFRMTEMSIQMIKEQEGQKDNSPTSD